MSVRIDTKRGKRKSRSFGYVLVSICMWLLLFVLVTNRYGLLPYVLQEDIGWIMLSHTGWIILGLVVLGVVLTCIDIEILKKRRGWLNAIEVLRSLLLIAVAIEMLFLYVLG
ncbi:MAG: hypothetical protein ISS78_08680 [Phycisphaerae bacterium]|nr:hypothetical protein [Phycisphaerae bacterium]